MLYAILCYNYEAATEAWSQEQEEAVMGRLHAVQDRLRRERRLGPVARLMPTTAAVTLKKDREPAMVVDGPFAETKEQLLGFYLVECDSREAALDVARDLGRANPGGSYEIRPLRTYLPADEPSVSSDAPLQLGAVGQISRTVRDIKEAEEWYGKVLGLRHLFTFGKLAFFDLGGTRLYLTQEAPGGPQPESILYLRVPEIHKAHDELRSRGVEFTGAPHMIHKHADGTEEWMAFFKDPEGRPLAIMSQAKS
ncbi:MAG TPA: YciI family protein [Steroidobacteraceae bacterium]|jgi:catechol 2,3-dioxygenase-like lactoylglutathione lyase family enzyme|nr:YciI family protein [Steroidobacteraceae bacterium]